MTKPIESDYTSHVAYTRALEEYCWKLEHLYLSAERCASDLSKGCAKLEDERDALKLDAGLYRWLVKNHKAWSWNPSQFNPEIVSGFAAHGTGYLGHTFQDAIAAAGARHDRQSPPEMA